MLVVVAVIGILVGILLPTIGAARERARSAACAANLRQVGVALRSYLNDNDERMPQVWIDGAQKNPTSSTIVERGTPDAAPIGTLFAGTRGQLDLYGVNRIGPQRRPLNSYLGVTNPGNDEDEYQREQDGELAFEDSVQVEALRDPADRGGYIAYLGADNADVRSMYDFLGSSYVINDHALQPSRSEPGDELPTLVFPLVPPRGGGDDYLPRDGRMPRVVSPGQTWAVGDQPIYNYDRIDASNAREAAWGRDHRWHSRSEVRANLLFLDMSVRANLLVPHPRSVTDGPAFTDDDVRALNTTSDYTFLPRENWRERFNDGVYD